MKRLIVCCDGTWQELNSSYPSNVIKLAQAVKSSASEGVPQIVFYNDRTYSGLQLPPTDWKPLTDKNYIGVNLTPTENFEKNLPDIKDLEVLYRKKGN